MGSGQSLPEKWRSVSVRMAHQLMQSQGYTYLDVRTAEEYASGHVAESINIPYMIPGPLGLTENKDFVELVKHRFPSDAKIVIGCRSGRRSKAASKELARAGFSNIVDADEGYMGWVSASLPVA